jgi:hypothetical protein
MKKKILFQQNNEISFNCDLSIHQFLGFLSVKMKLPGNFQQKATRELTNTAGEFPKLPGNFQNCRGISTERSFLD